MARPPRSLVPDYLENIPIYASGKPIEELAREKNLLRITKLASNENPLGPSPCAMREMTNALWSVHRYPDMHAHELKQALSNLYHLHHDNIVLGNGSEGIMAYILRAFVRPGDQIVTASHTFVGFILSAAASGAQVHFTPRTADYRYNVEAMCQVINEETRLIYLANPDNPFGNFITKDEFDYLMQHVPDHCLVIIDEAYFEFAKEQALFPDSMQYRYDNAITLRTFSKAYGISGIRIGYGFGDSKLISSLHKVKVPFEPNLIAQKGAVGALTDRHHLERTLHNNRKRYQETFTFLQNHNLQPIPSITNFITFSTPGANASAWLYQQLLEQGVIIRPLLANGLPAFLRVSIGTREEMEHFFQVMESALAATNWSQFFRGRDQS